MRVSDLMLYVSFNTPPRKRGSKKTCIGLLLWLELSMDNFGWRRWIRENNVQKEEEKKKEKKPLDQQSQQ